MSAKPVKKVSFKWENVVFIAIVLVIVQTVIEEVAALLNWNMFVRNSIMICGFFFDLFFTIEFFVRSYLALRKGRFLIYFLRERGWVDLLSSLPLLLLNTGPSMIRLIFGDAIFRGNLGVFNILKSVKAIRITRILRLIRVIKIFGKIKNTESIMAQRHVATLSTLLTFLIIIALFVSSIWFPFYDLDAKAHDRAAFIEYDIENYVKHELDATAGIQDINKILRNYQDNADNTKNSTLYGIMLIMINPKFGISSEIKDVVRFEMHDMVEAMYGDPRDENNRRLKEHLPNWIVVNNLPNKDSKNLFWYYKGALEAFSGICDDNITFQLLENFGWFELKINKIPYLIYINTKDLEAVDTQFSLFIFAVIFLLIMSLMLFYSPHFVRTVTDPIHVMNNGLTKDDYLLEVKIHKGFANEDIFELAKNYNEIWLPKKIQLQQSSGEEKLSGSDQIDDSQLDDIFSSDIFGNIDQDGDNKDS